MFWSNLLSLLRLILYGWIIALCRFLKILCRRKGDPHPPKTGCAPISHPSFVRPDPLLYSQRALIAQGLAVTYENPDISLSFGGVPVGSHELEPGKTYDVTTRVWNNSLVAPAIAMPVHLSFLDFGVGTEPIPIASGTVDVGVKGSVGQPAFVTIPWTTPVTPGHYCLQVLLDPVDDVDRLNNLGQENTDVQAAHSPAEFEFRLRNNTGLARRYHFEFDSYQIPALAECQDVRPDADALLRIHRRATHPVPAGFAVQINPATPMLNPAESVLITVKVDPPAGFLGRQAINVNAFHDQGFAGGVTLTCVKEV